jgi:hypothetical protein
MNVKWISLGMKLFPLVQIAVQMVEKAIHGKTGPEKQEAALAAIGAGIDVLEAGLSRDIIDNAEVQVALRGAIDAYVLLQNVVARIRGSAQ